VRTIAPRSPDRSPFSVLPEPCFLTILVVYSCLRSFCYIALFHRISQVTSADTRIFFYFVSGQLLEITATLTFLTCSCALCVASVSVFVLLAVLAGPWFVRFTHSAHRLHAMFVVLIRFDLVLVCGLQIQMNLLYFGPETGLTAWLR
jgi:hypothetical protein